ncbi:hypothetical protein DACRYDRAFT_24306 [Dacryopinax primogenitus]|uniref:Mob1/phocein n=1 Tax=Dacryopinax primogenitus (strain DJM 731) TaxID=1858805 RepID=M5G4R4_DACPD|nr:uncharacterized protein DACRYDRAFT_24306 [Dacryopinax primogenitus]EJT98727.1 hypothetical protein DACRYDRAFT_24306 [Dacryopinax primogenitus]
MSNFLRGLARNPTRQPQPARRSPTTPSAGQFPDIPGQNQYHGVSPSSPGKPLYLCQPFVKAALVKGSFKTIVMQPKYSERLEWIAVNIFDFFNNLNLFYGVLTECCTTATCPTMSVGPMLDYTWVDHNKRQIRLPAPTYIDYVMTWVQNLLDDEGTFPTKAGREFAPSFPTTARHVFKQLLRVFAHIYHAHYPALLHLHSEGHFNSLFAHFLAFGFEYQQLDIRDFKGVGVAALLDKWREMGVLDGLNVPPSGGSM